MSTRKKAYLSKMPNTFPFEFEGESFVGWRRTSTYRHYCGMGFYETDVAFDREDETSLYLSVVTPNPF